MNPSFFPAVIFLSDSRTHIKNEKEFTIAGIAIITLLIKGIGLPLDTDFKTLLTWAYAIDVLYVLFITALLWYFNRCSLLSLSSRLDWFGRPYSKLIRQAGYNILASGVLIYGCTALYFAIIQVRFEDETFYNEDLPLALVLTLLINLLYIGLLIWQRYRFTIGQMQAESSNDTTEAATSTSSLALPIAPKAYLKYLLIRSGKSTVSVDIHTIAFFYKLGASTLMKTAEGREYVVEYTLEQLEECLPVPFFFRANRQFIVHQKAVRQFDEAEHRKLHVYLSPALPHPLVVSQKKAILFKKWMKETTSVFASG